MFVFFIHTAPCRTKSFSLFRHGHKKRTHTGVMPSKVLANQEEHETMCVHTNMNARFRLSLPIVKLQVFRWSSKKLLFSVLHDYMLQKHLLLLSISPPVLGCCYIRQHLIYTANGQCQAENNFFFAPDLQAPATA